MLPAETPGPDAARVTARPIVGLMLALFVGCTQDVPERANPDEARRAGLTADERALQVELVVSRDLLRQVATGRVLVDSMYAIPGEAPGSASTEMRPAGRTRMLRDSLAANRDGGKAVTLRLSKPELAGNRVRITATIEYPMVSGPVGRGYETVEYALELAASAWTISTRVQLGVT